MTTSLKTHSARKFPEYYSQYERHFSSLQHNDLRLLEIGVQYGGSLKMWEEYFPHATITGIDIDPLCKLHGKGRITVQIGSQTDPDFLSQFVDYDIIIDDGGHTMHQQKVSFDTLFPLLKPGGIYVIEDLHTSYWPEFFDAKPTMMEYLCTLPHQVNIESMRHERAKNGPVPKDLEIEEIHFSPGICFIYKRKNAAPIAKERSALTMKSSKVHAFLHRLIGLIRTLFR